MHMEHATELIATAKNSTKKKKKSVTRARTYGPLTTGSTYGMKVFLKNEKKTNLWHESRIKFLRFDSRLKYYIYD